MSTIATPKDIEALMIDLVGGDRPTRQQAREALAEIGRPAVTPLIDILGGSHQVARWEAAKTLGDISDPTAAPALINALEDEALEVRWRAAESLAALKQEGLAPLLTALIHHAGSTRLQEGARHTLRLLARNENLEEIVKPVLKAIEEIEPTMTAPVAASQALMALRINRVPN